MSETSVKYVSPILGVADMQIAVSFYEDVLLFKTMRNDPNYSVVVKDHGSIHLRLAGHAAVEAREIYLDVTGIDELWEHVKQYKGQYKVRDLFAQDYGMREFHIIAPNDCLIFVGEKV